jgi:O-antigen/teichoic acid export membrane protein
VLISILGLITNIFIIRKLTVNEYGIFSVAFMLIGLVTTFGFSWSSSSILYYGSREKAKYGNINKTFWARNIIIFISLLSTTLLFLIFKRQINDYVGMELSFLILIWLYVSVSEDYLSLYFLATKRQVLSSMLSVTAKIIYLILIIFISFDVKTLIILNIISHATVLLYVFGIDKKDIDKFEFDKSWFKEVLNFSLWQLFGFSGLYLINFGDTAVIKHFMTTEDVGIYNAAYKLFAAISGFSYVISSYYASNISSYFVNNEYKNIRKFFYKERFIILVISSLGHFVVMLFAKQVIVILYSERYLESVKIFNILMIGSIFRYLHVFYMMYFNTNKKYKMLQAINIFRAVLNVGLDIIFINFFGLIGPAIATTTAIIVTTFYSVVYCEKRIKHICFNGVIQSNDLKTNN